MKDSEFPMRLNRFLALRGFATRRGADKLIENRRVFVNGKPAILGQKVEETDRIEIKDHDTSGYRYLLYYKPRGIITHSPEGDEIDIVTQIKKDHSIVGLFPIGRLDKDSEGLMILTNDGRITERILNPEMEHEREYEVTIDRRVTQTFCNRLSKGVSIEGYMTKPAKAIPSKKSEFVFSITLTEGKKHQVRRMCAALGFQVTRLKRTRMLNFTLKQLQPGAVYALKPKEVLEFQQFLNLR
ncbi:MAG: rRNA pseudouridine synthase [Candidatus Kaiserbacteria bacterium]|nr:rRNA pseudouridine synthase [Candidatus Kaiserbacteria bacterium]